MAESPPKQRKAFDAARMDNNTLRPWTVNTQSEEVLKTAIQDLEKTKAYTTPQKKAGIRGFSILDQKEPAMIDFENSIKLRATLNGYRTQFQPTTAEHSNGIMVVGSKMKTSSKTGSRQKNETQSPLAQNFSESQINNLTTPINDYVEEDDEDTKYIDKIRKRIYNEARHAREYNRPNTVHTVHFSKNFGNRSKLLLKEEQNKGSPTNHRN